MQRSVDEAIGQEPRINSYALVSYLPDPLAAFLNRVRNGITGDSVARAHVTVLPPRPLWVDPELVWDTTKSLLQELPAFTVDLGEVEIFPRSQVIYISIQSGVRELVALHKLLNAGGAAFEEPFIYHPHITLAQDIDPAQVDATFAQAAQLWKAHPYSRHHTIDRLTFVQNTLDNHWRDIDTVDLVSHALR